MIEIWSYIARANIDAADRVLDQIEAVFVRLAANPRLGPARPDLAPGLRYFAAVPYLVIYQIVPDSVQVVRVVHGARDLPDLFRDIS